MVTLLLALSGVQKCGISSPQVITLLLLCVAITVAWVFWESNIAGPASDLKLVCSRLMWPPYLTAFLFGMVMLGTQTIGTTFLSAKPEAVGFGFALAPGMISLLSAGITLMSCIAAGIFAYLAREIGMRGVLLLGAAANLLLVLFGDVFAAVLAYQCLSGLGFGLLLGAWPSLVAELSPADQTGIAAGIYNSLKTPGGAVFGVILASAIGPGGGASIGSYQPVWIICIAALGLCIVSLLFMRAENAPESAISRPATPQAEDKLCTSAHWRPTR